MTERISAGAPGAPVPSQRAFSLIELLVVIAIIAILAALLLPALHKAKSSSLSISCQSNQKQLELAWQMYHEEHNDRLVPNYGRGSYGDDGHVQFHKWKYPHRIRKAAETPIVNALDRDDLRWLLSRVPGPR